MSHVHIRNLEQMTDEELREIIYNQAETRSLTDPEFRASLFNLLSNPTEEEEIEADRSLREVV